VTRFRSRFLASLGMTLAFVAIPGAAPLRAQDRQIPFWPDEVPAALRAQVDGVAALETVRELGRFHRVHGTPGFYAAAEHMKKKLLAAGLSDASVERLPADGKTRYAHFVSYYGWDPVSALLEEVSPRAGMIEEFPASPVALADYSQDADVAAELVDVGRGTDAKSYEGRDIKGRIVLADGPVEAVHKAACEERGAAGFLSDFPNQTTAWSGDDRDLVRWGHLSPYQLKNRFAFMISKRQAEEYRRRLSAGQKIVLRARVRARLVSASFDVVTATIQGSDAAGREIILTAHLCHESAGANDNASGSAAIFEVARALQAGIANGSLPKPRLTIRFAWFPEIAGSQAWLVRHPEVVKRLVAGIHMDMVGGLLSTTKGTFHLSRTAESLPHVASEIAQAWFDHVVRVSAHHAERGGEPRAGLVWPPGSREAFLGDVRQLEMGSDHEVFEEASFAVPMVYFHDWPDVTIHTNKDQPENLDATKLGRVAYLGAGIAWTLAALPQAEAGALYSYARAQAEARIALARAVQRSGRDASIAAGQAALTGSRMLETLDALWPVHIPALSAGPGSPTDLIPVPPADPRVPTRNPEIRGPLDVYYFSYLQAAGVDASGAALLAREGGDVLAYEAFNLVDGRRSVSDIRDILTGRYAPVPVAEIAGYLDLLAKAGALRYSSGP
jgi:aminopeptidase YwaD